MRLLKIAAITLTLLPVARGAHSEEAVTFKAHADPVRQVAFAPDGKSLLTAGNGNHSLRLWNVANKKLMREFPGQSGIIAAGFTPSGEQVFATSWDRRVRMWDAGTGKLEKTVTAAGMPAGAAFSPTGPTLALAFVGGLSVQIVDLPTGKTIKTLVVPASKPPAGEHSGSQVRFSPDGQWLIAVCGGRAWPKYSGEDSVITVWDTRTWTMRARFAADAHSVNHLAVSRDGKRIAASCSRGKTVKVWNMPDVKAANIPPPPAMVEQWIKELDHDSFRVREKAHAKLEAAGISAAEALSKAARSDSVEVRYRVRSLLRALAVEPSHVLRNGWMDVHSMAYSRDGMLLAWGCQVAKVNCLKFCSVKEPSRVIVLPSARGVWSIAFRPDGKQLAAGNADGTVSLMPVTLPKAKVPPADIDPTPARADR